MKIDQENNVEIVDSSSSSSSSSSVGRDGMFEYRQVTEGNDSQMYDSENEEDP